MQKRQSLYVLGMEMEKYPEQRRRKYLGIGLTAVLLLLLGVVVVLVMEKPKTTNASSPEQCNNKLALHTLVIGRVFAVRCASGSRACGLSGPRCRVQAELGIESCQSICVFH